MVKALAMQARGLRFRSPEPTEGKDGGLPLSKLVDKTLGKPWVCWRDPATNDGVEERLKKNPDIPP